MTETIIRYKESKLRPRTIKVWETAELYHAMVTCSDIQNQISALKEEKPILLPYTLVDDITRAYLFAYKELMKEGLIKSGNIHKIQPTLQ